MLWRDVIKLIAVTYTQNAMKDMVESLTETTVYANKKSIRQSEFYQAMATGLKPELMFEVKTSDYSGQVKVKDEANKVYNIIRTFDRNGEITELICTGLVVG